MHQLSMAVIPEILRQRALLLGAEGEAWLAGIDARVGDLARRWNVTIGRQLDGGTESLVFEADSTEGPPAVLKLRLPEDITAEARALELADGVGYVRLLRYDPSDNALLLERLGPKLIDLGFSTRRQIEIICATLATSWRKLAGPEGLATGADKARWHAEFATSRWRDLGQPCERALIDGVLRLTEARIAAHDPARCVLVHGDAQSWNTLQTLDGSAFKLVDPDGLFAEPACDVSIPLREWTEELLAGDPLRNGRERCALLVRLTGVDPEALWQWGIIELVSTGLTYAELGEREQAAPYFTIADRWLAG